MTEEYGLMTRLELERLACDKLYVDRKVQGVWIRWDSLEEKRYPVITIDRQNVKISDTFGTEDGDVLVDVLRLAINAIQQAHTKVTGNRFNSQYMDIEII